MEGYEYEVVCGMQNYLEAGKINILAVDYHKKILEDRGLDPLDIHKTIQKCGYKTIDENLSFSSYIVYYRDFASC